ncbi:hypothetical protein FRX31_013761 [Thalictrum thalictroides]|uniref:Uncharacterized protein n=1 Tax=Thalictrum thalictroides TaxID=46969 RepID=A0A7J6WH32_THATH|nr:hypothetical protein FRX31_013761 [Thalictrum thalictroides]
MDYPVNRFLLIANLLTSQIQLLSKSISCINIGGKKQRLWNHLTTDSSTEQAKVSNPDSSVSAKLEFPRQTREELSRRILKMGNN